MTRLMITQAKNRSDMSAVLLFRAYIILYLSLCHSNRLDGKSILGGEMCSSVMFILPRCPPRSWVTIMIRIRNILTEIAFIHSSSIEHMSNLYTDCTMTMQVNIWTTFLFLFLRQRRTHLIYCWFITWCEGWWVKSSRINFSYFAHFSGNICIRHGRGARVIDGYLGRLSHFAIICPLRCIVRVNSATTKWTIFDHISQRMDPSIFLLSSSNLYLLPESVYAPTE